MTSVNKPIASVHSWWLDTVRGVPAGEIRPERLPPSLNGQRPVFKEEAQIWEFGGPQGQLRRSSPEQQMEADLEGQTQDPRPGLDLADLKVYRGAWEKILDKLKKKDISCQDGFPYLLPQVYSMGQMTSLQPVLDSYYWGGNWNGYSKDQPMHSRGWAEESPADRLPEIFAGNIRTTNPWFEHVAVVDKRPDSTAEVVYYWATNFGYFPVQGNGTVLYKRGAIPKGHEPPVYQSSQQFAPDFSPQTPATKRGITADLETWYRFRVKNFIGVQPDIVHIRAPQIVYDTRVRYKYTTKVETSILSDPLRTKTITTLTSQDVTPGTLDPTIYPGQPQTVIVNGVADGVVPGTTETTEVTWLAYPCPFFISDTHTKANFYVGAQQPTALTVPYQLVQKLKAEASDTDPLAGIKHEILAVMPGYTTILPGLRPFPGKTVYKNTCSARGIIGKILQAETQDLEQLLVVTGVQGLAVDDLEFTTPENIRLKATGDLTTDEHATCSRITKITNTIFHIRIKPGSNWPAPKDLVGKDLLADLELEAVDYRSMHAPGVISDGQDDNIYQFEYWLGGVGGSYDHYMWQKLHGDPGIKPICPLHIPALNSAAGGSLHWFTGAYDSRLSNYIQQGWTNEATKRMGLQLAPLGGFSDVAIQDEYFAYTPRQSFQVTDQPCRLAFSVDCLWGIPWSTSDPLNLNYNPRAPLWTKPPVFLKADPTSGEIQVGENVRGFWTGSTSVVVDTYDTITNVLQEILAYAKTADLDLTWVESRLLKKVLSSPPVREGDRIAWYDPWLCLADGEYKEANRRLSILTDSEVVGPAGALTSSEFLGSDSPLPSVTRYGFTPVVKVGSVQRSPTLGGGLFLFPEWAGWPADAGATVALMATPPNTNTASRSVLLKPVETDGYVPPTIPAAGWGTTTDSHSNVINAAASTSVPSFYARFDRLIIKPPADAQPYLTSPVGQTTYGDVQSTYFKAQPLRGSTHDNCIPYRYFNGWEWVDDVICTEVFPEPSSTSMDGPKTIQEQLFANKVPSPTEDVFWRVNTTESRTSANVVTGFTRSLDFTVSDSGTPLLQNVLLGTFYTQLHGAFGSGDYNRYNQGVLVPPASAAELKVTASLLITGRYQDYLPGFALSRFIHGLVQAVNDNDGGCGNTASTTTNSQTAANAISGLYDNRTEASQSNNAYSGNVCAVSGPPCTLNYSSTWKALRPPKIQQVLSGKMPTAFLPFTQLQIGQNTSCPSCMASSYPCSYSWVCGRASAGAGDLTVSGHCGTGPGGRNRIYEWSMDVSEIGNDYTLTIPSRPAMSTSSSIDNAPPGYFASGYASASHYQRIYTYGMVVPNGKQVFRTAYGRGMEEYTYSVGGGVANDYAFGQKSVSGRPAVLFDDENGGWTQTHKYDLLPSFPRPKYLLRPLSTGPLLELRQARQFICWEETVVTFRHACGEIAKLVSREGRLSPAEPPTIGIYTAYPGQDTVSAIDKYHAVVGYTNILCLPRGREWIVSDDTLYLSGCLLQTTLPGESGQVLAQQGPCVRQLVVTEGVDSRTKSLTSACANAGSQLQLLMPVLEIKPASLLITIRAVKGHNLTKVEDELELHVLQAGTLIATLNPKDITVGQVGNKKEVVAGGKKFTLEGKVNPDTASYFARRTLAAQSIVFGKWQNYPRMWVVTGDYAGLDFILYDTGTGQSVAPLALV